MADRDTDNFAHIIGKIREREENLGLQRKRWEEFDEAQRRQSPWCWAIGVAVAAIIWAICHFNS